MTYPSDDLAPLFPRPPAAGVGYRQGIVRAWNPANATNVVEVDGIEVQNLPVLNTSEALLLQPGDVVGILTIGQSASSWAILGRLTIPGTPQAASALSMVSSRIRAAQALGTVTTSSTTWQSLGGPVIPDVRVGQSGKALVMVDASVNYGTATAANTEGGEVSFEVTGATIISASASNSATDALNLNTTSTVNGQLGRSILLEGMTPGLHTFTHMVRAFTPGRSCNFDRRSIVVFAL